MGGTAVEGASAFFRPWQPVEPERSRITAIETVMFLNLEIVLINYLLMLWHFNTMKPTINR